MKFHSKKGYEFSFAWMFAVLIGGMIIFFAIYFATQIVGTQQAARDVSESKSLGVLLTPIETKIEAGKFAKIYLTDPTRIYFKCELPSPSNPFGSQKLRMSIKPSLGYKWEDNQATAIVFHNKYFFATGNRTEPYEISSEGEKEFYVLSKPLFLPFKIADLMIIYSDKQKFCFKNIDQAPIGFKNNMIKINMTNVQLKGPCNQEEHQVICFDRNTGGCDITVNQNQKTVKKGERTLEYLLSSEEHDPYVMLYAAIFSDPNIYECQIKRLISHASKLTDIYYRKSEYINQNSNNVCSGEDVRSALLSLNQTFQSGSLHQINQFIHTEQYINLKEIAGGVGCELF